MGKEEGKDKGMGKNRESEGLGIGSVSQNYSHSQYLISTVYRSSSVSSADPTLNYRLRGQLSRIAII